MKSYAYDVRLSIFLILTALLVMLPIGCEEDKGSDVPGGTPMEGITTLEAVIGPEGGDVEITDPLSPIYRAGVYIPPDMLSEELPISITWAENHENWPSEIVLAGEAIRFDPDGIQFDKPVELFLPYKDEDNDGMIATSGLDSDTTYFFKVTAVYHTNVESADSQTVSATTL